MKFPLRTLLTLSLLSGGLLIARGELVLTNFNAGKLLKVMAIGDSITDDCSFNGAWRAPLQPMLETNGFPFTFTGRQVSTASAGFSKTRHEGYCGAVVATPGVFGAHQYSTTDNYLQKIVPDALAVAVNKPDVVLIFIGANDIGRGRDPYHVATNDMATLVDMILSNVPPPQVILAKATSLQNGNVGGQLYGSYAPNVPIFNAFLQKLVNGRRALGQNVFLVSWCDQKETGVSAKGDNCIFQKETRASKTGIVMQPIEGAGRMVRMSLLQRRIGLCGDATRAPSGGCKRQQGRAVS